MTTIDLTLPTCSREIPAELITRITGFRDTCTSGSDYLLNCFLALTGLRPIRRRPVVKDGRLMWWFRHGRRQILLTDKQLTEATARLAFLLEDFKIPVPRWRGSTCWFHPPVFGLYNLTVHRYLNCENQFAAWTRTNDERHLVKLALNLWDPKRLNRNPEKRIRRLSDAEKSAITMFYTGMRVYLTEQFPLLYQKRGDDEPGTEDVTQLIRILNGGDVTRNEAILKANLWDALKQLEDMAMEAERIKKSLKK